MEQALSIVVLAAGKGTRMRSRYPKLLHPVGGRPMLDHVLRTAFSLEPEAVHVVHGHGAEAVQAAHADWPVRWVVQEPQLGTGHAVEQAIPAIPDDHQVLVLYGDVPLVRPETLQALLAEADGGLGLLSVDFPDPTGYGRVLRDGHGAVTGVVEHKDATAAQRRVTECNTGLLAAPAGRLKAWLQRLDNDNAQAEYYLTDVIAMAVADGVRVAAYPVADPAEVQGVNDRVQLAAAERVWQRRQAEDWMRAGVTILDPDRFDLRGHFAAGEDCRIDVGVVLEGRVELGAGVEIGPHCVLRDVALGDGTRVEAHSVLDGATAGRNCRIGPFARLRPGTDLADGAKVGNFVETKAARIGPGSKVNHLSYMGDAELGRDVNVGAGTITCNYDGHSKHRTEIGDGAFIGSGTQLVAPVRVGRGATIGAGSTVTRDAPDEALTVARSAQRSIHGWRRPGQRPDRGEGSDA
ncbi:bifunctional UDP-N-acetylglucosamine diphosphorylase/glucosamine-1-phosphate N-acetyltransferase GlmU [Alkalilimnicola ehrlichii MLHE-1]|uniref:Bifunctional protein GlmU n=1 Tax=Alkalilimnicola ehrlichii (strain ATCC BAA-1101 / DSM 17681 / MLHE-1) TaxID=187272 RepID=GLMU_ALKEH|nr:bifunctional UDP-N-acetylglucosamine diphosphorylase/glucosamine-1-phosphate N-acetyltransferase GlmU [Alkalilimnicola ehrlichii]Q0A4N0.2 RecName: Full=Bifunctional protein GlmU; Includes: RecName: Full=UDP-N-acetylglucosamine pyrophosphorylase; AltName: Full=N-acetylglucosamine-1-phosphate uridyltransferase; Includes: RecName: Full=Glucosamine-1-phosphate N-acetyltransferase [Alkalilimnicola ehrlichii MLHE-1]